MNQWTIARRGLGLAVLMATVAAGTAQAAEPTPTSACSQPNYAITQPFAGLGDTNWYTLAPGQGAGGFNGAGWTLTGGAKVVTTTLPDGTRGQVLDLPAGSTAVSPQMCVDSDYPTARANVLDGGPGSGVHVSVSYTNSKSANQSSGVVNGASTWGASRVFQLHAGTLSGWQSAQYTFQGGTGDTQVYDFYVDPRCSH